MSTLFCKNFNFFGGLLEQVCVVILAAGLADRTNGSLFKIKHTARERSDLISSHGVITFNEFIRLHGAAEIQLAAAKLMHARAGVFQPHQDVGFELFPAAVQFIPHRALPAELTYDFADQRYRFFLGILAERRIYRQHARIMMVRTERINGITQAVLLAYSLEQAGGHPAAKDGAQDLERIAFVCGHRQAWKADAKVVLFDFLWTQDDFRMIYRRRDLVAALAAHGFKQGEDVIQIRLVEPAGNGNDRVGWAVIAMHIGMERIGRHAGKRSAAELVRLTALFYLVSCAVAGGALALGRVSDAAFFAGGGYYIDVPFRVVAAAAAAGWALTGLLFRGDAKARKSSRVHLDFAGRGADFSLLVDTGNDLSDPVSGRPALVLDRRAAARVLPVEAAVPLAGLRADNAPAVLAALPGAYRAQFQLLPYRAVGKESGLLLAFRPERAARDGVPWQGLAAISPERVANGQYEGLIGL